MAHKNNLLVTVAQNLSIVRKNANRTELNWLCVYVGAAVLWNVPFGFRAYSSFCFFARLLINAMAGRPPTMAPGVERKPQTLGEDCEPEMYRD